MTVWGSQIPPDAQGLPRSSLDDSLGVADTPGCTGLALISRSSIIEIIGHLGIIGHACVRASAFAVACGEALTVSERLHLRFSEQVLRTLARLASEPAFADDTTLRLALCVRWLYCLVCMMFRLQLI